MFRFVPRFAAVLLVTVAGTLAPAATGDRPFHATGGGPAAYGGLFAWDVRVRHLGRSFLVVGFDQTLLEDLGVFMPGRGTIVSASGDELYFYFDADYYLADPAGVVSATVTFTGGTGRFQDATGSADMMIDFDVAFQSFSFLIDGSIDY